MIRTVRDASVFVLIFLLTATVVTSMTGEAAAGAKHTFKLGTTLPPDNIITRNAQEFAKKVNERSSGDVEVVVYPSLLLGNERDMVEGIQLGTVEMAFAAAGIVSMFAPEAGVLGLPFIFRDWDHLERVLKSPVGGNLADVILKKTGMRTLGWLQQGFRVTLTVKKTINDIRDFEGLKIRLPEEATLVRTFQLVKARPTVIPWGEVYTSLQTGVVDGMESTPTAIYSMKFYEVASYLAETDHQHGVVEMLISEKTFKSLSPATQAIIQQAARETMESNHREARGEAEKALSLLRARVKQTTRPDLRPFREAVQPAFKEYGDKTGTNEIIRGIQDIR